ncbi:MAG: hypothetical protein NZ653_05460 [Anaerolineae bacterium]|nr:hypothetical protein [Anaerolineae bacterium]
MTIGLHLFTGAGTKVQHDCLYALGVIQRLEIKSSYSPLDKTFWIRYNSVEIW